MGLTLHALPESSWVRQSTFDSKTLTAGRGQLESLRCQYVLATWERLVGKREVDATCGLCSNFRVARDSIRIVKAPRSGPSRSGRYPLELRPASAAAMLISACRQRTDRNVISVRISERELLRSSVRIEVWLLFESTDERACPLKRQVEIIDTKEQQEAIAGCPVIRAHQ